MADTRVDAALAEVEQKIGDLIRGVEQDARGKSMAAAQRYLQTIGGLQAAKQVVSAQRAVEAYR